MKHVFLFAHQLKIKAILKIQDLIYTRSSINYTVEPSSSAFFNLLDGHLLIIFLNDDILALVAGSGCIANGLFVVFF